MRYCSVLFVICSLSVRDATHMLMLRRLHLSSADIRGRRGRVIGIKERLYRGIEPSLRIEDKVDRIASCPLAARVRSDIVRSLFGLLPSIRGCNGESARTHHREVDDVVTHIGEFLNRDPSAGEDIVDGAHLMRLPLIHKLELEILRADRNRSRLALRDDSNAQATEAGQCNAETIVRGEALEFKPVPLAIGAGLPIVFRKEKKLSVGEHAVDVEDQDFDAAGAVFCR